MVINATFKNSSAILWWSVLISGGNRSTWRTVLGEHHRPAECHWQNVSHNFVSSTPYHGRNSNSQR